MSIGSLWNEVTYFRTIGVPRHVLDILFVFHKVGPSRADLWVFYLAVFELQTEICVDGEEERVQPPIWGGFQRTPGVGTVARSRVLFITRGLLPVGG
jgi:hypothetical protein